MAESTLQAKRYAQAAFEIAQERKDLDIWQSDLQKIAILAQNEDFVKVMENPKFAFENKKKLLDSQLKKLNPLALNLAYILTNNQKFSLMAAVFEEFQVLLDDFRAIEKAEITTAVPLSENEKQKIVNFLSNLTGKKVIVEEKVDPGIIGGMIARVGGKIIDGSTSSQLAALRKELINAGR